MTADGISYAYGERVAVDAVSLQVAAGEILGALEETGRSVAVVLTTHDMHEADALSDGVAFIDTGAPRGGHPGGAQAPARRAFCPGQIYPARLAMTHDELPGAPLVARRGGYPVRRERTTVATTAQQ